MSRLGSLALCCLLRNRPAAPIVPSPLSRRAYSPSARDLQPKDSPSRAVPAHLYKHEARPTDFDKKILVWTGRYKKAEDIPEYVSWETISAARSNLRVKICMAMIIGTLIACVFMVRSGKQALKEDRTLIQRNIDRKAKWKEEAEKEKENSTTLKSH